MTTPTPEEAAAMAEWWRSVATDWNGERMVDGEPVRIVPSASQARKAADMLESLSRARDAEWNAAIEAAIQETKQMPNGSLIADIEDAIRALLRPEGGR